MVGTTGIEPVTPTMSRLCSIPLVKWSITNEPEATGGSSTGSLISAPNAKRSSNER